MLIPECASLCLDFLENIDRNVFAGSLFYEVIQGRREGVKASMKEAKRKQM